MSTLDNLTQNTPVTAPSSGATQQTLPDWYNTFIQGIASRGLDIANQGYQAYPGQMLADFSPMQQQAFGMYPQAATNYAPWLASAYRTASAVPGQYATGMQGALNYGAGAVNAANTGVGGALGALRQYGGAGIGTASRATTGAVDQLHNFGGQAVGAAQGAAGAANSAVSPGTPNWSQAQAQQYMSPYTHSVVDEIARLGNRNFQENIAPNVGAAFLGSGQFGSSRNAEILGRAARDTQRDITGQQASALESGYGTAANIFGTDQARQQAQQQLRASTALQGGQLASGALSQLAQQLAQARLQGGQYTAGLQSQLGQSLANAQLQGGQQLTGANLGAGNLYAGLLGGQANAGLGAGSALGSLAQLRQALGLGGANALYGAGQQQQQQQQQGLNLAYQDFQNQTGFDMNQLNQLKGLISGLQLPAGGVSALNSPTGAMNPSPLALLQSLFGG